MQDAQIWQCIGAYLIPGMQIAVRQGAWGKDKLEYPNKPYGEQQQEMDKLSEEEELQKRRESFVMNMRIRKMNWDLEHPKKQEGGDDV